MAYLGLLVADHAPARPPALARVVVPHDEAEAAGLTRANDNAGMNTVLEELAVLERGELILDSGRTYDGHTPVRVHVRRREMRLELSDGGGAIAAAGADPRELELPDHIPFGDYSVNVSRKGIVFLPAWTTSGDEWLETIRELVVEGSLALYQALLDAA